MSDGVDIHGLAIDGVKDTVNMAMTAKEHLAKIDTKIGGFVGQRVAVGIDCQRVNLGDQSSRHRAAAAGPTELEMKAK
jgi:hypothetical protein